MLLFCHVAMFSICYMAKQGKAIQAVTKERHFHGRGDDNTMRCRPNDNKDNSWVDV